MNVHDILLTVGFLGLFLLGFILCAHLEYGDGDDHNLDWHRRKGQWQVRYSDGRLSQPAYPESSCAVKGRLLNGVLEL